MILSTSSMLAVSILAFSTLSACVDGQIRHRNGPGRVLEEVVLDSEELLLEESLSDEMEWVDFSMELSISLSMSLSMSMQDDWTAKSSKKGFGKGPKGEYGPNDESISEGPSDAPSDLAVDHKGLLMKRSYVEDEHGAMKLFKI